MSNTVRTASLAAQPKILRARPVRWALAFLGVVNVAVGAVGVFIPGLPTTIFLIVATWCFAKSCPWMEDRLIRNRLFAPVLAYVDRTEPIPVKAKVGAIATMWACVGVSVSIFAWKDAPLWLAGIIAAAACVGSAVILRWDAGLRE